MSTHIESSGLSQLLTPTLPLDDETSPIPWTDPFSDIATFVEEKDDDPPPPSKAKEIAHDFFEKHKSHVILGCPLPSTPALSSDKSSVTLPPVILQRARSCPHTEHTLAAPRPSKRSLRIVALKKALIPSKVEVKEEEILALQEYIQITKSDAPPLDLSLLPNELFPRYMFNLDDVKYYCSILCSIKDARNLGCLALVQINDKIYPRIFYCSNSQATWRTIPALGRGRIGKGYAESDTCLPINLNLALFDLPKNTEYPLDISALNIIEPGFDQCPQYKDTVTMHPFAEMSPPTAEMTFYKRGLSVPKPPIPSTIKMPKDKLCHPCFAEPIAIKPLAKVPHYGSLIAEVYPSFDQEFLYLIYRTSDDCAFLALVENIHPSNKLTPFGVKSRAYSLLGMDSPMLEYHAQIPREYEPADDATTYTSHLYDNNGRYVQGLEIILQYNEAKSASCRKER